MATSRNVFRNLGKSVAYSSLDVMTSLAPNTMELARVARSGADATRDFIRLNTTKIRTTTAQYDRSAASKKAKSFLQDAWEDIKRGNLALGELSDQSFDDWDSYVNDSAGSSIVGYENQRPSEDSNQDASASEPSKVKFASTDYRTIAGLQQLSSVLGKTQLKAAQYQTTQITNAIFMQMANQNDHFITMERQLDAINKNIVQLVEFQSKSQSVTNQAHLQFYDQMTRWIKKQEEHQKQITRRITGSGRNKAQRFLGEDWFDIGSYKEMVKSNVQNSELGMLVSMIGMMDPTMLKMAIAGPDGKIQPQRLLLNQLIKMAIPRQARRSLNRGDNQINTMVKTMLTRLGGYQYKMDRGGTDTLLGLLGTVFGIDPNLKRTLRMGDYKHGEMTWNGDAQKALVTVIPKELAEIKAAITKQKVQYYDSQTGRFLDADQIRQRARNRFQDAVENPFANIFNSMSINPDDVANKKFWDGMSRTVQENVSRIINEAVINTEGLTDELTRQMHTTMDAAIKEMGGTVVDTRRMAMSLASAINKARSQTATFFEQMQATDSAFTQLAMDSTNDWGNMTLDKFMEFINASAVDLVGANNGTYTQSGRRRSAMSAEERRRTEAQENTFRNIPGWINKLKNSQSAKKRVVGTAIEKAANMYTGNTSNAYSRAMSGAVDKVFGKIYDTTMLGDAGTQETGAGNTNNGGVRNRAYDVATSNRGNATPETRTAESTERMAEDISNSFGQNGFMRRVFDSPIMKRMLEWFNNSTFGKNVKGKIGKAGDWLKSVFNDDIEDENGNTVNSIRSNFRTMSDKLRDSIYRQLGFNSKTGEATGDESTPAGAINNVADAINEAAETVAGDSSGTPSDRAKKSRSSILKSFQTMMRKKAPKIFTGGILGAGIGMASAGHLGLLGSLFLPGGPVGGAIAGMGLSILTETEAFKSLVFGKKNDQGEREGGLISQKMVDGFKKALPTLGLGATAGVILKLLGKATGIGGGAAASVGGLLPSMLLPGGILGAAIMGAAGAFALKNERVQNILFGKQNDDGTRTGTILSGAYNKLTGKIKSTQKPSGGKKSMSAQVLNAIKGAGIGAFGGATLSHLGLLGSAVSFGGPIGAAIAGAAVGIAASSDKFNDYLYGTKGDDGKRQKDGLLSRVSTLLKLNFVEPAAHWFQSTTEEFMWWAKEKIEVPFRLAFGPVIDGFKNLGTSMKDTAQDTIKNIGERVGKKVEDILSPIGGFFMDKILKPLGSVAGGLIKGGLFGAASIVGAPLQLASMLLSPTRRKGEKAFGNFLKNNKEDNLSKLWAQREENGESSNKFFDRIMYNMATLPVIGSFFRSSDIMADMADIYGETTDGKRNSLNWLSAKADRRRYKNERKAIRKDDKEWRKLSRLRQQWAKADNNVSDKVLSDKEFTARTKELRKHGIDITSQEELRKFTYNYDEWANPKISPADQAAATQTHTDKEVTTIRELAQMAVKHLRTLVDVSKANIDMESGQSFDTEDISDGESIADKIDASTAEEIQRNRAKASAQELEKALDRSRKKAAKEANDAKVRGNTSGNAHDEVEMLDQLRNGGQEYSDQTPNDSEDGTKSTGLLGGAGSFIRGLIGSKGLLVTAGVGVLTAILSNPEIRQTVANLIGDGLSAIPNLIKSGFENAGKLFGQDGGINDQRALEKDENGNVTESVKNTGLLTSIGTSLLHPTATLKAAKTVALHTPIVGTVAKGVGNLVKGAGKVANVAKSGADKVAKAATKNGTLVNKALTAIKAGLEKAMNSKIAKGKVGTAVTKIASYFDDIVKKVAKSGSKLTDDVLTRLSAALAKAGITTASLATPLAVINAVVAAGSALSGAMNPERLFKIDAQYVDGKMRIIAAIWEAVANATGMGSVIAIISEIVTEITGFDFVQSIACLIYNVIADDDDDAKLKEAISNMQKEVDNYNSANGTSLSIDAYNDLKNKGLWGGLWNKSKNIFGKGDTTDYSQYSPENYSAANTNNQKSVGTGAVGYGPAMQADPRWGNMTIGKFPNGRRSTMATGGCGPTALANAANALGIGLDPKTAGQFAAQNGYIAQGGATEGFFDRGARQMGLNTRRVGTTQDITSSLRHGNPVILAGKSRGYGGTTPYTGAGHIVTATGMDGSGNVIVQDPMRGTGKYRLKDLQGKMTAGWSVGRGAAGYGLIDSLFGGALQSMASGAAATLFGKLNGINDYESAKQAYSVATNATDESGDGNGNAVNTNNTSTYTPVNLSGNDQAEKIWNYLIGQGFTPNAAAGIMGCWNEESNNRSDRIEGDYLKGFPGFRSVLASNASLDTYTTNKLFPAYARSNISINKNGYKGTDGHYYPGIGLAQWTGPRGYNLFKYAQEHNLDWRELSTQLAFFNNEITQRGIKSTFNKASSPENGAHIVLDNYEMYKGYGAKAPSALQKRQNAAKQIYARFGGRTNAAGYGIFDTIGNAFSGAISGIYSALGLRQDNADTTGDNTNNFSNGVDYNYTSSGNVSQDQYALVDRMKSVMGKLRYSLKGGEQNPDNGVASCASTVGWAYRKTLGLNNMSASSTDQSKDSRFATIWVNNGGNKLDFSQLQPGDIVYQNWKRTSNNGSMAHTEMYAGDGKTLSHGGNPELGPTFKEMNDYRQKHTMMVRRYKGFMNDTAAGTGFGGMDLNHVGQYSHDPSMKTYGYGPGTDVTTVTSNRGVETRLDTIIGLMRTIAGSANKQKPATTSVNVNYGEGDKVVKPTVIVKQTENRRLGEKDASNEYLRTQHRKLASAIHA